jgi:hypothetical protein
MENKEQQVQIDDLFVTIGRLTFSNEQFAKENARLKEMLSVMEQENKSLKSKGK